MTVFIAPAKVITKFMNARNILKINTDRSTYCEQSLSSLKTTRYGGDSKLKIRQEWLNIKLKTKTDSSA